MAPQEGQPFVWQKTERRGPVAAQYTSPGPAVVTLPGLVGAKKHDLSKARAPMFSFGRKSKELDLVHSPGPGVYNVSGMSIKGGRILQPSASIQGRYKDLKYFATPAPGTYAPEKSVTLSKFKKNPGFSFGSKYKEEKLAFVPAPNQYAVPSTLGRRAFSAPGVKGMRPGFTLAGRPQTGGFVPNLKTPGPGAYDQVDASTTRRSAPSYSMTSRNITLVDPDSAAKPGPGAHFPEQPNSARKGFSFGMRHSEFAANVILH